MSMKKANFSLCFVQDEWIDVKASLQTSVECWSFCVSLHLSGILDASPQGPTKPQWARNYVIKLIIHITITTETHSVSISARSRAGNDSNADG